MTNIKDLLDKVKGDKLSSEEFVRLVTAVIENQDLGKQLLDEKIGYVLKTIDDATYARFFCDEDTANNYLLNPDDPDFQPIVSILLPTGGGGGEASYVVKIETNSAQEIETSNKNVSVNLRFVSQYYNPITQTLSDTGEDATLVIQRQMENQDEWITVGTINSFPSSAANTGAYRTIDLKRYLETGTQYIRFAATGNISGVTTTLLTFTISVAEMSARLAINWGNAYVYDEDEPSSANIMIPVYITGNVYKILFYEVYSSNGSKIKEASIEIGNREYTESTYQGLIFDHPQIADVCTIKLRLRYGNTSVYSEWIEQNFMTSVKNDNTILLCTNNVTNPIYNWSSQHLLDYAVYNPNTLMPSVVNFELKDNDELITWLTNANANVQNGNIYDFTPYLGIENSTPSGRVRLFAAKLKISVQNVLRKTIVYSVDNTNDFAPTEGANFVLMPSSRSNYDVDKTIIHNETTVQGEETRIQATWTNVIFEQDGWINEDSVKRLRLFAGSNVVIPFESYSNTSQLNGLTIEIDFNIRNVSDEETPVVKMGKELNGQFVGLILYAKKGYFFKTTNNESVFQDFEWRENTRTHIAVNIIPRLTIKGRTINLVRVFINGIINREFTFSNTDRFWDGISSEGIQIGSTAADIDVFGMRVFKEKLLSSTEVFNDYIASISDIEEKQRLINANNITENGIIKYSLAKLKYNTIVWKGVYPSKDNKIETTGDLTISILGDKIHSGNINNMTCKGQGTSSMRYLYFNGSWKFNDDSVFINEDGQTVGSYYKLRSDSPKATKLVGKINWASSPQSHKAGMCDMINVFYDRIFDGSAGFEPFGAKTLEGYENTKIAVQQEPFLFFVQETEDSEPVFYGNMTFGPGKGDKLTFGYDKKHPILKDYLMIEGSDQTPYLTLCQVPWFEDEVVEHYDDKGEFDGWAYPDSDTLCFDYDLGNTDSLSHFINAFNQCFYYSTRINYYNGRIEELQLDTNADKSYQLFIVGQTYGNFKVYRYDHITHQWVNAGITKTNGVPDEVDLNDQLGLNLQDSDADFDGMLARVKAARCAAFREIAGDYFHVNDTLFGMQINKLMAASDNRAKNTYPYYDPVYGVVRFASDDNDTILPFNNKGQKQKPYWVEEHDFDSRPAFNDYYWAGSGNAMYNLFEDAYSAELRTMMTRILSVANSLGVNYGEGGIMGCFDRYFFKIQNYIPAVAYNECARLWYEWAKILYDAGEYTNDTNPITQSLGDQLQSEKEWVSKRIFYLASYCRFGEILGGSVEFRQQARSIYSLTPAMKMYMYLQLGTSYRYPSGYNKPKRCEANETVQIECEGSGSIQTYIVAAEYLNSIGDLSNVAVTQETAFGTCKRLIALKVGDSVAENVKFKVSSINSFPPNAITIDLRNIDTLTSIGDLSNLSKLTNFYCSGTAITSIKLPQTNNINTLVLNSNIQTLELRNQNNISTFEYTPTNLLHLTSGNCNVINQTFIENWLDSIDGNLNRYTLNIDGINWTNFSEDKLLKLLQFDTCILQGTIAMNSLSPSTKIALMNMYGNIDDENNSLYVTYPNGVSISGDKSVIRGGAGDVTITVSIIKYVDDAQITVNQTGNFFTLVSEGEIQYDPVTGSATKKYVYHTETLMDTSTNFSAQAVIDGVTYTSRNFNVAGSARITITSAAIKKMVDGSLVDGSYYYTEDKAAENNTFYIVPNTTDGRNAFVDDQGNPIPTDTYRIEWGISDLPSSLDECYLEYEGIGDNEIVKVMKQNVEGVGVEICRMPKYPNPANKAQWWNSITFSSYVNEVDAERLGNDPDFRIVANLVVTNRTAAAIQTALCPIVGHPEFFAVQAYDPTKPNYNPAVCIILEQGGLLDRTQLYTDGGNMYIDPVTGNQGLVMTMDEAAAVTTEFYGGSNVGVSYNIQTRAVNVTNGVFFQGKSDVTPTNITDCYEQLSSYEFKYFRELKYFKNIQWDTGNRENLSGMFVGCVKLEDIRLYKSVERICCINRGLYKGQFALCLNLKASVGVFKNIKSFGNYYGYSSNLQDRTFGIFYGCVSLNWESLPPNIEFIGVGCFNYVDSNNKDVPLPNINIHTIPSTLTHAYGSIPGDWSYVPDTVKVMYTQNPKCSELSLPNSVNVNNYTGFNSNTITNVVFRGLTENNCAFTKLPEFHNCNFDVFAIPNGLNRLERYTFKETKFNKLIIPDSVNVISYEIVLNSNSNSTIIFDGNILNSSDQSSNVFMRTNGGFFRFKNLVYNLPYRFAQIQNEKTFIFVFNSILDNEVRGIDTDYSDVYVFITSDTPHTITSITTGNRIRYFVPINSLNDYKAASVWSTVADKIYGYDYTTDPAHVLTAESYDEVDQTKFPS